MKKALQRLLGRTPPEPDLRVLMVCSGNICRSPTAEAVLRQHLDRAGLSARVQVDSAGTHGFHMKEPPDPRAQAHAKRRGYDLSTLRARRVQGEDFEHFHRILAMDEGHLEWLRDAAPPGQRARVELLMRYATRHTDLASVPDPYYGSPADFERVLDLVEDACAGLVVALQRELGSSGRVATRPAGDKA